jgi:hypothetical protein
VAFSVAKAVLAATLLQGSAVEREGVEAATTKEAGKSGTEVLLEIAEGGQPWPRGKENAEDGVLDVDDLFYCF